MEIHPLTQDDAGAYRAYRCEMWPSNSAAGDWETICIKYFQNPLVTSCPGSGLYGCFDGGALVGVWGAYPMPVTLNGVVYPGHALVDSFVLERCRNLPVGGVLFRSLQNLPGRKYASHGAEYLQTQLARIAWRIECTASMAVWKFVPALAGKLMKLAPFLQPCPLAFESPDLTSDVKVIAPSALIPEEPVDPGHTAFVRKDPTFWKHYCLHRIKNAALPLAVRTANAEAHVVIRLEEVGRIRIASLMSLRLAPYTVEAAREVGRSLRVALSSVGVCAAGATEPDAVFRALQDGIGIYVRRRPVHWWSIPRKIDTFEARSVKWRLTLADRDSHWGFIQPSRLLETG